MQQCFRTKWFLVCLWLALSGCAELPDKASADSRVKNVILIIGDGMGPQQVGLLLAYARQALHGVIASKRTAFDRLLEQNGKLTISTTHAAGTLVTDSGASASQLATGYFANPETLGLDKKGNRRESIVERAKRLGKATGLVSDTRITHATPAAFAAHRAHRTFENEIAEDLLAVEPDVMLSAGWSYWLPESVNDPKSPDYRAAAELIGHPTAIQSKRHDTKNLLDLARKKGYALVFDKERLLAANGKTLGLFAATEMPNGIAETRSKQNPTRIEPTLKEMSQQALNILSAHDRGFFLMIEAGQIDWASHNNDTGMLLHEMLRLNETLDMVLDWLQGRDDTLLIVTADHETGGFGFSYSAVDIPEPRSLSGDFFRDGAPYQPSYNYGNPEVLDKLYAQQLSYFELFHRFDTLPKERQTPVELAELVNRYTEFKIDDRQAARILATEANRFYRPNHKSLNLRRVPVIGFNSAFFPYQAENRLNLLAREVAESQHAVWSTGTHTATPVYVFVKGPSEKLNAFNKILHHTEIGRLAIDALQ
ncbi:MAG: alkaline phosphatase [Methylomicrobium sp.]